MSYTLVLVGSFGVKTYQVDNYVDLIDPFTFVINKPPFSKIQHETKLIVYYDGDIWHLRSDFIEKEKTGDHTDILRKNHPVVLHLNSNKRSSTFMKIGIPPACVLDEYIKPFMTYQDAK